MELTAFDVETTGDGEWYGLQPWRVITGDARITSFATAEFDASGSVVVPDVACESKARIRAGGLLNPTTEGARKFLTSCHERKRTIVGWNTTFDAAWLIAMGLREEVYANHWLDGMLLWKHLTNAPESTRLIKSYGLKSAVARYYPQEAGYEAGVDFDAMDRASVQKRLRYNIQDACFTLRLTDLFLSNLSELPRRAVLLEAACIPMVAEATVSGICASGERAAALGEKLREVVRIAFVKVKITDGSVTPEILSSPKQLSELLFGKWGLTPIKTTATGAPSVDKEVLDTLAAFDPRAAILREYREAVNNLKKFSDNTLASLAYNGDGRVRPAPRIFSTYTGRMTYSSKMGTGSKEAPVGIALHQWKRGAEYRAQITVPRGYELLEFDFSGQEFRWMAVESRDQTMLKLCEPGEDAHSYMGAAIAQCNYRHLMQAVAEGDPVADGRRKLGKLGNLSLQYRTSRQRLQIVAKVQYGLPLTDEESEEIWRTYRRQYQNVPLYWKRQEYLAKRTGVIQNLAGRMVNLMQAPWPDHLTWPLSSTAINFPIQSIGADQKYLALAVLRNTLSAYDAYFYFELHDGLFIIAPRAKAEKAAHDLKAVLSDLPYKKAWGIDLPIKFPVDAKRGPSWGELKGVK